MSRSEAVRVPLRSPRRAWLTAWDLGLLAGANAVVIVGVRHADGSFAPMPAAETKLGEGDVIMALGTPNTLDRLEGLFVTARATPVR